MKKQICNNCTFYSRYYRQFSSSFVKSDNGFCARYNKTLSPFDSCSDYKDNQEKIARREETRLKNLDKAIKSINEIAAILKDNDL